MMNSENGNSGNRSRIDTNALELIERRMSDRIEERVEKKLIKRLTWGAAIVFTVLGFFGYDLMRDTRIKAESISKVTVEKIIERDVAPVAKEAREKLSQAAKQLEHNKGRIKIVDEILAHSQIRVEDASLEVTRTAERVRGTLAQMNRQVDELRRKIDETNKAGEDQARVLRESVKEAGTLREINDNLASLAQQVESLDGLVNKLAAKLKVSSPASGSGNTVKTIIKAAQTRGEQYLIPSSDLVFFQFANLNRQQARDVAAGLRDRGYVVPGEDHEDSAAGLSEVRFFYIEDEDSALQLADQTNAVLNEQGYGDVIVNIRNLVKYKGRKPRVGVLELWLGIGPL